MYITVIADKSIKSGSLLNGKYYFTNYKNASALEYLEDYYKKYEDVRIVSVIIPYDSTVWYHNHELWYSNKIIIGEKYFMYDIKTVKKFNLNLSFHYHMNIIKYNKVNILEYFDRTDFDNSNYYLLSSIASENGCVDVLEWWCKNYKPLRYTKHTLNSASKNGYIHVLDWWKNSGLELKYDEKALLWASENGHQDVLEWWKNSGLSFDF
jgi:hypothetical protein